MLESAHTSKQNVPSPVLAELEVLIGTAQAVLELTDDAEISLTNARALGYPSADGAIEGEIHFIAALLARKHGDWKLSQSFLDAILSIEELPSKTHRSRHGNAYPFTVPYWRARAFEIRAFDFDYDSNSVSRAANYAAALSEFDRAGVEDRFIEASVLYNATVLTRESGQRPLVDFLIARAGAFPWSPGVRFFEFFVFHNLGSRCAYEGDHLSALRNFRRSAEAAPSAPLRLLALLDRYHLIFELGEVLSASEELDYALRLANQIDWSATTVYERSALLTLSRALARVDVDRARAAFNRYHSTTTAVWSVSTVAEAKQKRASSCYAEATILFAEGQTKRAVTSLLESFEASGEIGYERLRAIVALELWEHTGEVRFADVVNREALRYRDSILARRMRALKA